MIKTSFIALTLVMATLLICGIRSAALKALPKQDAGKLTLRVIVAITAWLTYVTAISISGALQSASIPPRIPLLLIFPLLLFMAFAIRTNIFGKLLAATPAHFLIYPQVFRLAVELLLLALFHDGLVPEAATFAGYNYEIIVAITALATGYIAYRKKKTLYSYITIWNISGLATLAIVVFIFITSAYFPFIYRNGAKLSMKDFGSFPNTLLAGFLMPLAVFLHITSLLKTKRTTQS